MIRLVPNSGVFWPYNKQTKHSMKFCKMSKGHSFCLPFKCFCLWLLLVHNSLVHYLKLTCFIGNPPTCHRLSLRKNLNIRQQNDKVSTSKKLCHYDLRPYQRQESRVCGAIVNCLINVARKQAEQKAEWGVRWTNCKRGFAMPYSGNMYFFNRQHLVQFVSPVCCHKSCMRNCLCRC